MIRGFDAISASFLASESLTQERMARAQGALSSGLRVTVPSDDPAVVTDILELHAAQSASAQTESNLNRAKTELQAGDSALQTVELVLEQALSLGAQGANSNVPANDRAVIAEQLRSIQGQLVSLMATEVNGKFIFSGDSSQGPAYALNLTGSATGVDRLTTASSTLQVADAQGARLSLGITAGQLLDHRDSSDVPDGNNVFAAIFDLSQALANNDQTGIESAQQALQQARDYFGQQQALYGQQQQQIDNALAIVKTVEVGQATRLSNLQDADITAAAIELQQTTTQQQTAMAAFSKLPHTSLFDYLG